jgi:hypothetical protein
MLFLRNVGIAFLKILLLIVGFLNHEKNTKFNYPGNLAFFDVKSSVFVKFVSPPEGIRTNVLDRHCDAVMKSPDISPTCVKWFIWDRVQVLSMWPLLPANYWCPVGATLISKVGLSDCLYVLSEHKSHETRTAFLSSSQVMIRLKGENIPLKRIV